MTDILSYCYKKKILASIYCDPDDSQKHYTGYVEKFNNSEILIAHISENGYYDGYVLRPVKDVYRIDFDGKYEKKIGVLYNARGQTHTPFVAKNAETLFLSALKFAKENNFVVSLIFEEDCRSGLIESYNDDTIYLYSLNDNGESDGVSVVKAAEILALEIDTEYEQNLKILREQSRGHSTGDGSEHVAQGTVL